MKTLTNINTLTVKAEVEVLRAATKRFITDEGGRIGRSWDMQQCGNTVWWESFGYVGDQCVTMRYYEGDKHILINNHYVKIVVE